MPGPLEWLVTSGVAEDLEFVDVRKRFPELPDHAVEQVWARVCAWACARRACMRGCVRVWLRVCVCAPMMCACASVRVCVWGRACERMPPPAAL